MIFFVVKKKLGLQIPEVNKHQDSAYHQIQTTFAINNKIVIAKRLQRLQYVRSTGKLNPFTKHQKKKVKGQRLE